MRNHRWRPKGKGWIRTFDRGSLAIWMRPEIKGIGIAIYNGEYPFSDRNDKNLAEVHLILVPKGSHLPYMIMDKPHRTRSLWTYEEYCCRPFSTTVRYIPHCHYGHPRLNKKREVFRWPLPPKIERLVA